ncbi:MAG: flavin reductase family protein [Actinomycetota bacterium]|nr:flavin reductase family protein [Actinomycetota bacterium]MDH5278401.1 flavin reductase family protein [Actinomycetota bacterium]
MSNGPSTEQFREAVSRFATGLTVVTCVADGVDHAMTANSFVSVSLEPLLVLVSVEQDSRFHEAVTAAGAWSVSILPESAEPAARWFATRGRPLPGQFERFAHHRSERSGAVLLDGALAALECRTWRSLPAGDHDLLVGLVVGLEVPADPAEPLLYHRRHYATIGPAPG